MPLVAFAITAPSATAGQRPRPKRTSATSAIPAGAHTGVITPCATDSSSPTFAAPTYAAVTRIPTRTRGTRWLRMRCRSVPASASRRGDSGSASAPMPISRPNRKGGSAMSRPTPVGPPGRSGPLRELPDGAAASHGRRCGGSSKEAGHVRHHPQHRYPRRQTRRLVRVDDGRWLGGVAAGLGRYFDVNPLVYRLPSARSRSSAALGSCSTWPPGS